MSAQAPRVAEWHTFERQGRRFAFHGASVRAFELEPNERPDLSGSTPWAPPPLPLPFPHAAIRLDLTTACNLDCVYCYAKPLHRAAKQMSPEVMQAAIRFLTQRWAPDAPAYDVSLCVSGEPTLVPDLVVRAHELVLRLRQCVSRPVSFWIATNAVTIPPAVFEILEPGEWSVSVDGPEQVHNALRPGRDGRETHQAVLETLEKARAKGVLGHGEATITPAFTDYASIAKHLVELGFPEVELNPIRGPSSNPLCISERSLPAVCEGLEGLADAALEDAIRGSPLLSRLTSASDYLGRFLRWTLASARGCLRCPAGKYDLTTATDGSLYPCPYFVGDANWRMGSVFDGLDLDASRFWLALSAYSYRECRDCWARFVCKGPCPWWTLQCTGSVLKPNPIECQLNRFLIELAVWFWAELRDRAPEVYHEWTDRLRPGRDAA